MRRLWILVCVAATAIGGTPQTVMAEGVSWQSNVRITNDRVDSFGPDVAVDGDTVHIVWLNVSKQQNGGKIFYRRSEDRGATWGNRVKLKGGFNASGYGPSIAVAGDTVHVAWIQDGGVRYERSTDGGTTWSRTRRLSSKSLGHRDRVDLAVAGNRVHAVWGDTSGGDWEIVYRRSTDGGETWRKRKWVTNTETWAQMPSVAAKGKAVHIVFWQSPGRYDYRRSTNRGKTFSETATLTGPQGSPTIVALAAARSYVAMAWFEWTDGGSAVMFRRSSDKGQTWGAQYQMSDQNCSANPAMAATGRKLHVIWTDCTAGNPEVYYRRSSDEGVLWNPVKRITNNRRASIASGVAAYGATVHLVWRNDTKDDWEVYYKHRA